MNLAGHLPNREKLHVLRKNPSYAGHSAAIKQQIVDMAMNASGIRDTARVLHVRPTTVIKELKKN